MATLPTVGGDNGNWGTILNTFLQVAHNSDGTLKNQSINVKDYGATGDGTTDDTVALQAAFSAVPTGGATVYFPVGDYKTTATIDIPNKPGMRIVGAGCKASMIISAADNEPILRANYPDNNLYDVFIEDIGLKFATRRTSAKTDAYGIQFKSGTPLAGYYHWNVKNVEVYNSYIGIGIGGSGTAVIWGSTFDNVSVIDTSGYGFKFWCTGGAPRMLFRNCVIWNQTPGLAPSGAAFSVTPMYFHIDGMEVLGWDNQMLIECSGISIPVIIDNLNVEGCLWNDGGTKVLLSLSGGGIIRQASFIGTVSNSTKIWVVFGNSVGGIDVNGLMLDITLATGGESYPFAQCKDLYYKNVNLTKAVTFLYYDNESQGSARRNLSATIYTKAGAPTDADFDAPANGLMALDTTNNLLYIRVGGAWKSVLVA